MNVAFTILEKTVACACSEEDKRGLASKLTMMTANPPINIPVKGSPRACIQPPRPLSAKAHKAVSLKTILLSVVVFNLSYSSPKKE
jgi:hypothetical protein